MKGAILVCLIIIAATLAAQTERDVFTKGQDAIAHYRYEQAIRNFYDCYQADPQRLDCLQQLAWCHQQMGNMSDARLYYQSWAHADSLDPRSWVALGDLASQMGETDLAQRMFSRAVHLDSTNAYFLKKLGNTLITSGRLPEAISAFMTSLNYNDRDLETAAALAECFIQLDALDQATEVIEHALALNPTYRPIIRLGVRLANRLENHAQTIAYGQRLLATGDSALYYTTMTGYAWFKQDSLIRATELLGWVCKQERASELAHFYYALSLESSGRRSDALAQMAIAIEKGQSDYLYLFQEQAGRLNTLQKNYKEAVTAYEAALRLQDDPEYLFQIGRVYDEWYKDKSPAIRYFQNYLRTGHQQYADYTRQRLDTLKSDRHQKGTK
ncbi:MAG: tetratricopeptide repeat protein [Saprospiraceae bacterium]|nr:tetratricopeptide repeat protein [Saprospiraceae bacterium]